MSSSPLVYHSGMGHAPNSVGQDDRRNDPQAIVDELREFIDQEVARRRGRTSPIKPKHRVLFHWPPHPVSMDFHVRHEDWTEEVRTVIAGEEVAVAVARTQYGVFGRNLVHWNEARGASLEQMLKSLAEGCRPMIARQKAIAHTLGMEGRFCGSMSDLRPADWVKLLYCSDRDVTHEARTLIEIHASEGLFAPALIEILRDRRHRYRRSAQWAALDSFEDLPSFCHTLEQRHEAIQAIHDLIWDAEDDYARTIYKAGVVLGGHVCTPDAARALIDCVGAPSKIGRRSAIHAVFHLVEWMPDYLPAVLAKLGEHFAREEDPLLRDFTQCMIRDIGSGALEHVTEPTFPEEA